MTVPDFTTPSLGDRPVTIDDPADTDPLRRQRRRPRHRDTVLVTLLVALLAVGGFLAGFVVALQVVDDRPPCTRTITQLPRPGVDERPRTYGNQDQASAIACDVESPADYAPWDAERDNG